MKPSTFELWEKIAATLETNKTAVFEMMVGEWARHLDLVAPKPAYLGPTPPGMQPVQETSEPILHPLELPDEPLSADQLNALRSIMEILASMPTERLNYIIEIGAMIGANHQPQLGGATNRADRLANNHPAHDLLSHLSLTKEPDTHDINRTK